MAVVGRGQDGDEQSNRAAATGPGDATTGTDPADLADIDLNDPDVVKVHYDLSAWNYEQRAEVAETFAEQSVPHAWDGDEIVVPEVAEEAVDAIFEALEAELGPFPVVLEAGADGTEFGLDEWPPALRDELQAALVEAQIPHRWEGASIIVAAESEDVVDDLLDAIEAGDVSPLDQEAPDGALHDLHRAAGQLARQPAAGDARETVLELTPRLSDDAPPFGLALTNWRAILERTRRLVDVFESGEAEPDQIADAASDLRDACRPWV